MLLRKLFTDPEIKKVLSASMMRIIEAKGDSEIIGLTDDSRKVRSGYLFIAIKGLEHDGHDYIDRAVANGASTIVYENRSKIKNFRLSGTSRFWRSPPWRGPLRRWQKSKIQIKDSKIIFIEAENCRRILGLLWAAWYAFPSRKIKVIGVTGTDGKTTTVNLIYHLLRTAGKKVGMVSTINARIGTKEIDTGFHVTNPEPALLQKLLRQMATAKLEFAVIEVTSHGIDQERIAGTDFYAAVMTNVTHEHLDYHGTYNAYLRTKGKLFEKVDLSILNRDDRSFNYLKSRSSGRMISYGFSNRADLCAKEFTLSGTSSFFRLASRNSKVSLNAPRSRRVEAVDGRVQLGLPGRYNIYNALAASAVGWQLGLDFDWLKAGLESFSHLEGRFDEVNSGQPFRVIIDFAHTPNALEQLLELSSKLTTAVAGSRSGGKTKNSKLWVVFGCAGERDREKRPMMGEIAGRTADVTILTAEDPRREDVNEIIDQIAEGCEKAGAKELKRVRNQPPPERGPAEAGESGIRDSGRYFVSLPDRREAIEFALKSAKPRDIVLITGKGHEKSMCFGKTEYPWNDREAAVEILGRRTSKQEI